MDYPVLIRFRDRFTGLRHRVGSVYCTDDASRAAELASGGFIAAPRKVKAPRPKKAAEAVKPAPVEAVCEPEKGSQEPSEG